jgi:excisionase family DNA binding protein
MNDTYTAKGDADATIRCHHVKDFCRLVGISRATLWKYAGAGKIKIVRVGRRVLVPDSEAVRIASEGLK